MRSPIARFAFVLLLVFLFEGHMAPAGLQAQVVDYLKPIGGSDVELYFHLQVTPSPGSLRHEGEKIEFATKDVAVTYTLGRGKVTHVAYHKTYPNQTAGEQAFQQARSFMESQGIAIKDVLESNARSVASGAGNGFHGSLLLVSAGKGGYRLEAEIFAQRK